MKLDSYDVYLHGQILGTHTFFLKNGFPVEDEYSELKMKTFLPGCIAALLRGLNDEETVAFAAACSSVAVSRYPLPLNPPKQEEVDLIIKKRF